MTTGPESLEELARLRQGMYRVFATGFLAPDADRITNIRNGAAVLETLGVEAFVFYPEWTEWHDQIRRLDDRTELGPEYTRLFVTGSRGAACPPTESYYTSDSIRGEVGSLLAALRREYERFRITPTGVVADTIDHVAIELEAMAWLCSREVANRGSEDGARLIRTLDYETGFLGEHLGHWLPLLVAHLGESEPHPYYATLGPAVGAFVDHDQELSAQLEMATQADVVSR